MSCERSSRGRADRKSASRKDGRICPMEDVIDIEVTPLSAACGAEIKGIDLTRPLSNATVRAIKDAWAKHLVLVFRGQSVSEDDQLRFASYFGALGDRKKAPEQLRGRAEGIQQENQRFSSCPTSRSMASRSARSAKVNSGSTSIPAIRRDPISTPSCMPSSCRPPAATPCSPTCTRHTRPCRRR